MNINDSLNLNAIIDEGAVVGVNTRVWHNAHIMKDAVVGSNCNIGENVFVESGVVIGDNVKVKNNVALYTGVVVEDDVFLGPNCVFTNVNNPRSFIEKKSEFRKTIVHKGASIGANATIICGNSIGEYAFVGAGAVVTKDVDAYSLVVGNPARFHAYVCKCGTKLDEKYTCVACGLKYKNEGGNIILL